VSERLAAKTGKAIFWRFGHLAVGRVIYFVGTLVLARLLVPDDFGLLAIGALTMEILLSLSELGMRGALVQRQELDERHFHTAWTANLIRALVVAIIAVLVAPLISTLFEEPRAENIIRLMAFAPLLAATGSIKTVQLHRALNLRPMAINAILQAITQTVVAIALAKSLGVWALVVGSLSAAFVGSVISHIIAPYRPRLLLDKVAAGPLLNFGRWILLIGIIEIIGETVIRVTIARQLSTFDLGLYYLGARLALLPYTIVSEVISHVTFPMHAKLQVQDNKAGRTFRGSLIGAWAVLVPGYAVLLVLATGIVQEVLGAHWSGTAPAIRVLAIVGIVSVISLGVNPLMEGRGAPSFVAMTAAVRTVVIVSLAWVLAGRFGIAGAALAWLLGEVVVQIISGLKVRRVLNRPFSGLWRSIGAIVVSAGIAASAAFLCEHLVAGLTGVILAAISGCGVAVLSLWLFDHFWRLGLLKDLAELFPFVGSILRPRDRVTT
jgi:PST family polysaccharide transporter